MNEALDKLMTDRYLLESWNFGYSAKHKLIREVNINDMTYQCQLEMERGGKITAVDITPYNAGLVDGLSKTLHTPTAIRALINQLGIKADYLNFF